MPQNGENYDNVRKHFRRNSANNDRQFIDSRFEQIANKHNSNNSHKNSRNKKQVRISTQGPVFLQNEWAFWYDANNAKGLKQEDYESNIIKFGSFKTIQDFWRFYNNIVDPQYFPTCSNLRLFKDGIKPSWEDPANQHGGQWTIRTQKNETGKFWIQIVLYMIGEQFTFSNEICGIVMSVRPRCDSINIWNRNSNNLKAINSISNQLRKLLKFDPNRQIAYKKFDGMVKEGSEGNISAMDNRLTMSASDVRIESSKLNLRTTSLDDLISSPLKKFSDLNPSDSSDFSDISDGEAYELNFDEIPMLNENDMEPKSKHKKSSSFSSSPFPNVQSPSWKQHRKTNSASHQKSSSITPKYSHLQSSHRRQLSLSSSSSSSPSPNGENESLLHLRSSALQKSKFQINYNSLQKELYSSQSPEFSPYEIHLDDISKLNQSHHSTDADYLSSSSSSSPSKTKNSSISLFLIWTIGVLFVIFIWALWFSELLIASVH